MKYLVLITLALATLQTSAQTPAKKRWHRWPQCHGASPCKACKNCKYCKWCEKGGGATCGTCKKAE